MMRVVTVRPDTGPLQEDGVVVVGLHGGQRSRLRCSEETGELRGAWAALDEAGDLDPSHVDADVGLSPIDQLVARPPPHQSR